ncbi:MAG: hypothetical protein R3B55_01240 [Candidatus Paceibacterota bacterium]
MFKADEKSVLDHYGKDDAWCLEKGTKTVENLKAAGRPVEKEAIEYGRDIIEFGFFYDMRTDCGYGCGRF